MKKQFLLTLSLSLAACSLSTFTLAATHSYSMDNNAVFQDALQLKNKGKKYEAEQAFMAIAQNQPGNLAAIEQLAIVQSWQNKFDLAIGNFKKALMIDEHYTPARVGLARVSYWQGQRTVALAEIKRALIEQPQTPSHWILKGDILMANAKPAQAREAYLQAQAFSGSTTNASLSKKIAHAKAPKAWRLDAGYISDSFSKERVDGHSAYLQLGYTLANTATLYIRGEEYSSFDTTDTGTVVGAYFSPHTTLLINAEYYLNSNQANFRPNQQTSISADIVVNSTWQPLLGFKTATYDVSTGGEKTVTTLIPGLRVNYDNASIEFRHARTSNIDNTATTTNTLKLNLNYDGISPYLVYTQGEEGVPPLAAAKISVIGAGAVFKISDRLGFRIDLSREDRKDTYLHNTLGAGLSVYF
jgi:YaiO family outer membrane protein